MFYKVDSIWKKKNYTMNKFNLVKLIHHKSFFCDLDLLYYLYFYFFFKNRFKLFKSKKKLTNSKTNVSENVQFKVWKKLFFNRDSSFFYVDRSIDKKTKEMTDKFYIKSRSSTILPIFIDYMTKYEKEWPLLFFVHTGSMFVHTKLTNVRCYDKFGSYAYSKKKVNHKTKEKKKKKSKSSK